MEYCKECLSPMVTDEDGTYCELCDGEDDALTVRGNS